MLRTDVNGSETIFYDVENMDEIGKRAHVLKHSHGRCIVGAFYKMFTCRLYLNQS